MIDWGMIGFGLGCVAIGISIATLVLVRRR